MSMNKMMRDRFLHDARQTRNREWRAKYAQAARAWNHIWIREKAVADSAPHAAAVCRG